MTALAEKDKTEAVHVRSLKPAGNAQVRALRVVFWGTYDLGKPRNRIMLRGLWENGVEVIECHASVWDGVEDKSLVTGWGQRLRLLLRWVTSYPGLVFRYLRLPKHDAVIVGYPGQIDVLVLWPFTRSRGVPIVLDAFISLYNTTVEDRGMVGRNNPVARLLFGIEWLACRAADRVILDTQAHAEYFQETFRVAPRRTAAVFVGAEADAFPQRRPDEIAKSSTAPVTVLFYGQCAPLHGVETIIRAAQMAGDLPVEWVLIGQGQEEVEIRRGLEEKPVTNLRWISWVDYAELKDWILRADVCLGIFGNTDKAARVIPNKVYQALAAGVPVITRDSPAIRELLNEKMRGVYLVPPDDPSALVDAVRQFVEDRKALAGEALHEKIRGRITPRASGVDLIREISEATGRTPRIHEQHGLNG